VEVPLEPFIVSGEGVLTPSGRSYWVTPEMVAEYGGKPSYAMQEASVFFGRGANWLRRRMEARPEFPVNRSSAGYRQFTLHQIELLAHTLLTDRELSPLHFAMVIRMIKSAAILHTYEIGDTGFLQAHWNGALHLRRQAISAVMDHLEHHDAHAPLHHRDALTEQLVEEAAKSVLTLEEHLRGKPQ
jgi:hypothetical protein